MCNPVAIVMAVSAIASGAQQQHNANMSRKTQSRQEEEQRTLARQQANQRSAASSSSGNYLVDLENETAGGSDVGLGNTFLTGSQGVSNDQLNLGGGASRLGA